MPDRQRNAPIATPHIACRQTHPWATRLAQQNTFSHPCPEEGIDDPKRALVQTRQRGMRARFIRIELSDTVSQRIAAVHARCEQNENNPTVYTDTEVQDLFGIDAYNGLKKVLTGHFSGYACLSLAHTSDGYFIGLNKSNQRKDDSVRQASNTDDILKGEDMFECEALLNIKRSHLLHTAFAQLFVPNTVLNVQVPDSSVQSVINSMVQVKPCTSTLTVPVTPVTCDKSKNPLLSYEQYRQLVQGGKDLMEKAVFACDDDSVNVTPMHMKKTGQSKESLSVFEMVYRAACTAEGVSYRQDANTSTHSETTVRNGVPKYMVTHDTMLNVEVVYMDAAQKKSVFREPADCPSGTNKTTQISTSLTIPASILPQICAKNTVLLQGSSLDIKLQFQSHAITMHCIPKHDKWYKPEQNMQLHLTTGPFACIIQEYVDKTYVNGARALLTRILANSVLHGRTSKEALVFSTPNVNLSAVRDFDASIRLMRKMRLFTSRPIQHVLAPTFSQLGIIHKPEPQTAIQELPDTWKEKKTSVFPVSVMASLPHIVHQEHVNFLVRNGTDVKTAILYIMGAYAVNMQDSCAASTKPVLMNCLENAYTDEWRSTLLTMLKQRQIHIPQTYLHWDDTDVTVSVIRSDLGRAVMFSDSDRGVFAIAGCPLHTEPLWTGSERSIFTQHDSDTVTVNGKQQRTIQNLEEIMLKPNCLQAAAVRLAFINAFCEQNPTYKPLAHTLQSIWMHTELVNASKHFNELHVNASTECNSDAQRRDYYRYAQTISNLANQPVGIHFWASVPFL